MRRALCVIVSNEHGVLSRIVGLFSGRGYNIDSLTVAPMPGTEFSRVNIITSGDEKTFEQITKQLHKLIPTYKVLEGIAFIEKELALLRIKTDDFAGLDALLASYGGVIAHSSESTLTIMLANEPEKIDDFLATMKRYKPIEVIRSGSILMEKK